MTETREVELGQVRVEGNFRRHFDAQKLKELTSSIQEVGVLEPILVREMDQTGGKPGGAVILIAGERRLRAAKAAGLKTIPARILNVDAKAAAEIQLLENLHREDLGPLDEAEAFKMLLEDGKHTVETLADRVDKSVAYVYRAMKLTELPLPAKDMIAAGLITPAHGHQIMRAPQDRWEAILDHINLTLKSRPFPVWELRNHIDWHHSADLGQAIFPKTKAYAGEIACTGCPFNSGNQGQLFDGAEKGKCCNTSCYNKKTGLFMEEYSKEAAAEHPGLQYLGVRTVDLMGTVEGLRRACVVATAESKTVRKLMKEQPEKFGWAVIAPRNPGDKPTSAVICLDKRLGDSPADKTARSNTAAPKSATSAREAFIAGSEDSALRQAVRDTVEPRKRFDYSDTQWGIIHNFLTADSPMAVEGVPDRARAQELLVYVVFSMPDPESAMADMGIKVDKVKAQARKDAAEEWEKTKGAVA